MKRLLLLSVLLLSGFWACGATYRPADVPNVQRADRNRYVSNPDGILSASAVARLDSLCGALRGRGLAQVAVVAVDDIAGGDTFSFAIELFGSWGVGSAESDNGLGVLLVRNLHEIRFITGGGLEGILPDALCKRIQMKYMLPAFRQEDYDAGMLAGLAVTAEVLAGGTPDLSEPEGELSGGAILAIVGLVVGLLLALGILNYYRSRRCPHCRRFTLRQHSVEQVALTRTYREMEYTYVCSSLRDLSTEKLTFYVLLFGLSIYLVRLRGGVDLQPVPTPLLWINAVSLALFPTIVSLVTMAGAIRRIGSTPTAILGALEPVTALFFGVLVFGEQLTPRILLGVVLILVAVTLIIAGKSLRIPTPVTHLAHWLARPHLPHWTLAWLRRLPLPRIRHRH